MRATLTFALVAATLCACKSSSSDSRGASGAPGASGAVGAPKKPSPVPPPVAAAPPAAGGAGQADLEATVDGKPVTMTDAFAWVGDDGRVHLLVQNQATTCDKATASFREIVAGEEDFEAIVGQQLRPGGGFASTIAQVSYGANTQAGNLGTATITGDAAPGHTIHVPLSFTLSSMAFGSQAEKKLVVSGTVAATGCPPPPPSPDRKPPPPPQAATIAIADQKLPIRSAAIEQKADGSREIVLSTANVSCDGFAHAEDDPVDLTFHLKPDADDIWQADLMGSWIDGSKADQIFEHGKPTLSPTHAPAGATTVDLALGGSYAIMGYPIALDGKVTAQVCPPPK